MCKVVFFEFFMQAIMNATVNGGGKFSTRCSDICRLYIYVEEYELI